MLTKTAVADACAVAEGDKEGEEVMGVLLPVVVVVVGDDDVVLVVVLGVVVSTTGSVTSSVCSGWEMGGVKIKGERKEKKHIETKSDYSGFLHFFEV